MVGRSAVFEFVKRCPLCSKDNDIPEPWRTPLPPLEGLVKRAGCFFEFPVVLPHFLLGQGIGRRDDADAGGDLKPPDACDEREVVEDIFYPESPGGRKEECFFVKETGAKM